MIDDMLQAVEESMAKAVEVFTHELAKLRTGRASLALLDSVRVDYYGTPTPLNQVASLTVVDARLITVKPWEKNLIPQIEKAVRSSDLGLNPVTDSELVRLPIPPLTQERRKDLAKLVGKITEDARVKVRSARRDGNELIKSAEKDKEISEDESKQAQKQVQTITDKYIAEVDQVGAAKEKEIMEV